MAGWQQERTHYIAATPDAVFSVVRDLSQTHEWMRSFHGFKLHEPTAAVGTKVDFLPPGDKLSLLHQKTAPAGSVTELDERARRIAFTQQQPGGQLTVTWAVDPALEGSTLRVTVAIDGPLRLAFAKTVAEPLLEDFAIAAARLFRMLPETKSPADPIKCVIAGGHSYQGRNLAADLICRGHDVFVLTDSSEEYFPAPQVLWDGHSLGAWTDVFRSTAKPVSVINLASSENGRELSDIETSNTPGLHSTRVLAEAVSALDRPVRTWVQGSDTAVYGNTGERILTENSPLQSAEADRLEAASEGVRAEHFYVLRSAEIIGPDAPLFRRFRLMAETGLSGPVGSGRQWVSWIHIADWLKLVRTLLGLTGNVLPSGVINASAPNPVRNADLMRILRKEFGPHILGDRGLPIPKTFMKLGAKLGRNRDAQMLTGNHVTSEVLRSAYYQFDHPEFSDAVESLADR
ncbi:SRPBCC family protein [Micrococcoides hystricis]|uniref:SRPBCC family protein n=1 Tax=Micrococcoides hystricis TaxID=1572761 RepID=A0ABV6P7Q1_9MICC